ncbi:MAG TPA: hypothetical protein VME46_09120 [Acidimicrobiales bacterium]|nr:hypothetical protein [Acidimicrobiales bacterium]
MATSPPPGALLDDDRGRALPASRPQAGKPKNRGAAKGDGSKRSGMKALAMIVGAIAVGGIAIWLFSGIFDLAFHIFEYAAIALVAGWIGYKVGHIQGRHETSS